MTGAVARQGKARQCSVTNNLTGCFQFYSDSDTSKCPSRKEGLEPLIADFLFLLSKIRITIMGLMKKVGEALLEFGNNTSVLGEISL